MTSVAGRSALIRAVKLDPVRVGKVDVHQYHARLTLGDEPHAPAAVRRLGDREAGNARLQEIADQSAHDALVVDHQQVHLPGGFTRPSP